MANLLSHSQSGNVQFRQRQHTDKLLPLVYEELRLLAVRKLSPELICIETAFLEEETGR